MFNPIIPISGIGGWNFLQATYDRQLESFTSSAQVKNDRAYMTEKLSKPIAVEDFLSDRRLMRTALTAFDLGGEEWKRGFIDKVLTEASDPESSFLARLNNPQYSRFAEALRPRDGMISLSPERTQSLADRFEATAFKEAVGEVDNSMRLSLNYKSEIGELVGDQSSEDTVLFRLLGSIPVRTVLESATNLPSDIRSLPIEKQAEMLKTSLQSSFGINDVSALTDPENIDRVIQRYHAIESITQGPSALTPGSVALTLLNGIGSNASQNLFLSSLL